MQGLQTGYQKGRGMARGNTEQMRGCQTRFLSSRINDSFFKIFIRYNSSTFTLYKQACNSAGARIKYEIIV